MISGAELRRLTDDYAKAYDIEKIAEDAFKVAKEAAKQGKRECSYWIDNSNPYKRTDPLYKEDYNAWWDLYSKWNDGITKDISNKVVDKLCAGGIHAYVEYASFIRLTW